jgi:magnesium transporter
MTNTLYLPELREMLAENNANDMQEFCTALHPARTADFMDGLTADEAWAVLRHADITTQVEIFCYFPQEMQVEILETQDRNEIAALATELSADDRVDLFYDVSNRIVSELMPLMPVEERRETLRLQEYEEGTAGAVMTTEVAKLSEDLTVRQALDEVVRQAEQLETIYYLYVVDSTDHLRGLVSGRRLISTLAKPSTTLKEIMESDLVTVRASDDQEEVANTVARYDLLAIPVVDEEHRMLGIITHDDVIDVVREEATEDFHRIAGVAPLEHSYLNTSILTMSWKRGMWLVILFFAALITAFALEQYEDKFQQWPWLVMFIPLVISSGGNSGNQSSTLVITALTAGHLKLSDWATVIYRELLMGLVLGGFLGLCGMISAVLISKEVNTFQTALIMPLTLVSVVICGTITGSALPLLFKRMGLDPALMSSPFVAGLIDILGIVIYMNVALALLP